MSSSTEARVTGQAFLSASRPERLGHVVRLAVYQRGHIGAHPVPALVCLLGDRQLRSAAHRRCSSTRPLPGGRSLAVASIKGSSRFRRRIRMNRMISTSSAIPTFLASSMYWAFFCALAAVASSFFASAAAVVFERQRVHLDGIAALGVEADRVRHDLLHLAGVQRTRGLGVEHHRDRHPLHRARRGHDLLHGLVDRVVHGALLAHVGPGAAGTGDRSGQDLPEGAAGARGVARVGLVDGRLAQRRGWVGEAAARAGRRGFDRCSPTLSISLAGITRTEIALAQPTTAWNNSFRPAGATCFESLRSASGRTRWPEARRSRAGSRHDERTGQRSTPRLVRTGDEPCTETPIEAEQLLAGRKGHGPRIPPPAVVNLPTSHRPGDDSQPAGRITRASSHERHPRRSVRVVLLD